MCGLLSRFFFFCFFCLVFVLVFFVLFCFGLVCGCFFAIGEVKQTKQTNKQKSHLTTTILPFQVQLLPIWEESIFGVPFLYEYLPNAPLVTLVSALPYLLHFAIPWVFAVYLWRMEVGVFFVVVVFLLCFCVC